MNVKITEEKLNKLISIVLDFLRIVNDSFQLRVGPLFNYIEFLTPDTRKKVIARYYNDLNLIVVNDDEFYELINLWVGSKKIYDKIKGELIKQIYKKYTNRFKSIYKNEIQHIKYLSDEQFKNN